MKWRGRLLTGIYCHWCWDWDGLPMDETCDGEWPCGCFEMQAREENTDANTRMVLAVIAVVSFAAAIGIVIGSWLYFRGR